MKVVEVTGTLYEVARVGRKVRRAYFTLIADRRLVRLGSRKEKTVSVKGFKVPFTAKLLIIGKYGSSGLEGFKEGGGAWIRVVLTPSEGKSALTLSLPYAEGREAKLRIEGAFELASVECPSWIKAGDLMFLDPLNAP